MAPVSQVPTASGSSEIHHNISRRNDSLYLLYKSPADTPNIQILFFHGLQRGRDYSNAHVSTWENRDGSCIWPQTWLVEEFPRAHVLSVCYTGGLKKGVDVEIYNIAENLLSDLLDENIGSSCPVVLVGHFIGGLVIKELCVHAHRKLSRTREPHEMARLTAFLNSIKGIFFYSTPHHGSVIASRLKQHFGSQILTYFETLSKPASRLNSTFDQIFKEPYNKWLFAGLGETLPTDMGSFEEVVVEEASARGTFDNFYSVPEADHFSICRPKNKILASFRKLTTFAGRILNDLKEDDERATARTIERLPLPFIQDPKYVELKITMIEVKKALESKTPGRVVTLYGASGEGKTSMARHLALYYQRNSRRSPDGVQDEEPGTKNSTSSRFTDGVVSLTCSSNEVIISPLLELWKKLGYQLLELIQDIPGNETSSTSIQESSIPKDHLLNKLTEKLKTQKILIILDDVHDSTLIQLFLRIPVESLKFLITTQNPGIWGDRICKRISIGTPTSEEACHILKKHAYGRDTDITQPMQDAIDEIVEKADHHPLVLANVAANIQGENDNELEEWENARRNFEELILEEVKDEATNPSAFLYDEMYPRTVKASMKMTLSILEEEVETRTLLLVASMFESQPIPEVVFKLFTKRLHGSLAKFPKWSKRLQDINFIRVDFTTISYWTAGSERTWFLHPLRQMFIEKIEESAVKSLVEGFLERKINDDDIAVNVLLLVYGQEKWRKQAAEALEIPTPQLQNDSFQSWVLHLAAIKPFVWLIHVDPGKEWEEKSHRLAKQILQKYIYCQELDDESVSILLSTTETCAYTLTALYNFSPVNSPRVLIPKTISVLLHLRPSAVRPGPFPVLYVTAMVLHRFPENLPHFLSIGYPLKTLVTLLAGDQSETELSAAGALRSLATLAENQREIGQFPNSLERLVPLLAGNVSEAAQGSAIGALGEVAAVAEILLKIEQFPNAIERLVAFLVENVSEAAQGTAAAALKILARDAKNKVKIGQFPNAIERLVALLAENVRDTTRESAVGALHNLALDAKNKVKIGQCPNAIERLVALLADNVSEVAQGTAAAALWNLAVDAKNQVTIGQFPNAIERLVALLAENVIDITRESAAAALVNLAVDAKNKVKIGQFPNAIERLVALLVDNVSEVLLVDNVSEVAQGGAAAALWNLAVDAKNQVTIGQFPNAIERLVALLADNVSEIAQGTAAAALWNLAVDAKNQVTIGQFPNAIERLVALLAENVRDITRESAAAALQNLAVDAKNKVKIGQFPNAIERLVALLAENVSDRTRQYAAGALQSLARDAKNKVKIGQFPNAMERLVALLAENARELARPPAAGALWALAGVAENRRKIGQFPNAVERFVSLLASNVNGDARHAAAGAVGMLARDTENRVKIAQFPIVFGRLVALLAENVSEDHRQYCAWETLRYMSLEVQAGDYEGELQTYEDYRPANDPRHCYLLACFVKANRGDFEGAVTDISKFIGLGGDRQYGLKERGIVRRMEGDLYGALADLNDSLSRKSDDYECLKHRGLVKFLLLDKDGACGDAEYAPKVKPAGVDTNEYGTNYLCLGTTSVEYLGYNLK